MQRIVLQRLVAVLMLVIPGAIATWGFLAIKDALFFYIVDVGNEDVVAKLDWLKLVLGMLAFFGGVAFIGGWILHRDRKRNYVSPRFSGKKRKKK